MGRRTSSFPRRTRLFVEGRAKVAAGDQLNEVAVPTRAACAARATEQYLVKSREVYKSQSRHQRQAR
jgi:hypothetical protein